jgi:hypothetical protein
MSLVRPLRPGKALISAVVGMLALPLLASCAYDDGYYDPAPVYGGGYGYGGYGYGGYGYNHGYYGDPCWPYGCDDWHHRHHHHGSGDDGDGDNSHHHHHGGGDPPGGGPPTGPGPQVNNRPPPPYPYPLWNKQQRDSKN